MAVSTASRKPKTSRSQPKQDDKSHIDVYLVVRGSGIDPKEISRLLDIKPTRTWRSGDLVHPPAIRQHKDDGWELRANYSRGVELTKYVEALVDQVESKADRFHNLPPVTTVYVRCDICDYEFRRTALGLSKKAIQGIAKLGAEVDIDYYDRSKHAD
jgi:hypothetical protein